MSEMRMWTTRSLGLAAAAAVGLAGSALGQVPCPPGSTIESEPCGSDDNGGCNMVVPAFQPVSVNETICGTSWSDVGGNRDTDWFEIVTTQPMILTWTGTAEFEVVLGYVPTSPDLGNGDCSTVNVLAPFIVGDPLVEVSITTDCLPAGTHWFFVAPPFDTDLTCGVDNDYVVTLTGTVCIEPTGACCLPDLSCVDGQTQAECAGGLAGTWQGEGTECATTDCLARPCPTDAGSILLEQMVDPEVMQGNGIACAGGGSTTDNGYARSYNLAADPQTAGEVFTVTCVEMGIEGGSTVDKPATLYIYHDTNGGAPVGPGSDLTILGQQDVIIPADLGPEVLGFVLASPVQVPADVVMVVELYVYDTGTDPGIWPGSNNLGESASSYLRAEDCGLPTFGTFASVGFPDVHLVQTIVGVSGIPAERKTLLGNDYDPGSAIPNPTGDQLEELNPDFGTLWTVIEFIDGNGNNELDPEEQIRIDDGTSTPSLWTAEEMRASIVIEESEGGPVNEWIYTEYQNPWTGNPLGAYREVYPLFGGLYVAIDWVDNGNGFLDGCDWLVIEPPGGGSSFYHVVKIGTNIIVREGEEPVTCPEDVNNDNVVNVLDLLAVLAAWGATGGPEDINGDGVVNVLDLLAVLAAWGPCP